MIMSMDLTVSIALSANSAPCETIVPLDIVSFNLDAPIALLKVITIALVILFRSFVSFAHISTSCFTFLSFANSYVVPKSCQRNCPTLVGWMPWRKSWNWRRMIYEI